jgi:general secretion pathway protein K
MILGGGGIGAPGHPMHIRVGEAEVDVLADDEAGKINPNTVSRDLLRGLLVAVGVDAPRAVRLSGEMADWRNMGQISVLGGPKIDQYRDLGLAYRSGDHPYASVDELALLPDMTPEIMARLRPWLSVYHEGDVRNPGGASPAGAAVSDARYASNAVSGPGFISGNAIIRVSATAIVRGRARFVRSAVVRVRSGPGTDAGTGSDLVQILTWE